MTGIRQVLFAIAVRRARIGLVSLREPSNFTYYLRRNRQTRQGG